MTTPHLITECNISIAWARAFLYMIDHGSEVLVVAVREFSGDLPDQDPDIARMLDAKLTAHNVPRIGQTALTIMPYEKWLREGKVAIDDLANWYLTSMLPRLKARCFKNRRGTYFERLVAYSGTRRRRGQNENRTINQLSYIIEYWKKAAIKGRRPRQSALQLSCFDPIKDDTGSALSGFPCLQQISFTYHENGSLELTAYYPTQYIFDRAYGNYLGLCQLGHMVAHSLGMRLTRFTCVTVRPEIGASVRAEDFINFLRSKVGQ